MSFLRRARAARLHGRGTAAEHALGFVLTLYVPLVCSSQAMIVLQLLRRRPGGAA